MRRGVIFFFFNDPATPEFYTFPYTTLFRSRSAGRRTPASFRRATTHADRTEISRSEEHTSELQSLTKLVCRLLLEKKNRKQRRDPRGEAEIQARWFAHARSLPGLRAACAGQ